MQYISYIKVFEEEDLINSFILQILLILHHNYFSKYLNILKGLINPYSRKKKLG